MKKPLKILVIFLFAVVFTGLHIRSKADTSGCHTCEDVSPGSPLEVRIEYSDGTSRSACGLRCAGAMLAAYREKDIKTIWVMENGSGKLIDAKKAFWVLGPSGRSRECFSEKLDGESFSVAHGGRVANFRDMMAALFSGMYDEVRKGELPAGRETGDDIASHPKCAYCGMDRKQYAHGRVLLKYRDGSEVGLCSIHCAGLDLALHPEKELSGIMVGTYNRRNLVDAEKAVWVLGGSKQGIMSIRGKWAFEKKEDAKAFTGNFGGSIASFGDVMTAAFEDMWEIIR